MNGISKTKQAVILAILLCTFAGYLYFNHNGQQEMDGGINVKQDMGLAIAEKETSPGLETAANIPEKPAVLKVDVKGAVKSPGVYIAKQGDRIIDLVKQAGNFKSNADTNRVNLAQLVEDQMVIYVPAIGEEETTIAELNQALPGDAQQNEGSRGALIDLNTATPDDLDALPGIGPARATTIVEYREQNGPFKAVEELKNISGIGDKTFEKLRDMITVK
ncbi:helix-hairpin-helix domain-containing protein [Peribacillus sp. SCS-155]|uniref:helix-hairpin-helix domain-containing protein n=1 Tax=Peribacillus sedimenti TaxID=3115297 RepID=UPI003905D1F9